MTGTKGMAAEDVSRWMKETGGCDVVAPLRTALLTPLLLSVNVGDLDYVTHESVMKSLLPKPAKGAAKAKTAGSKRKAGGAASADDDY